MQFPSIFNISLLIISNYFQIKNKPNFLLDEYDSCSPAALSVLSAPLPSQRTIQSFLCIRRSLSGRHTSGFRATGLYVNQPSNLGGALPCQLYNNSNHTYIVAPFSLGRTARHLPNTLITNVAHIRFTHPRYALREPILDIKEEGYKVITITTNFLMNTTKI